MFGVVGVVGVVGEAGEVGTAVQMYACYLTNLVACSNTSMFGSLACLVVW